MITTDPTYTAYEAVRQFHLVNEQLIGDTNNPKADIDIRVKLLRARLILEELGETSVALHERKLDEFADGLCDLLYVVMGTAVSCGYLLPDYWPNLPAKAEIPQQFPEVIFVMLGKLATAVGWVTNSMVNNESGVLGNCLQNVIREIGDFARICNINLEACFVEVHRANMSKKLGGAKDGLKYGTANAKEGYIPANLGPILAGPVADA